MLAVPVSEGDPDAAYLPADLAGIHRERQEKAADDGSLRYSAGQFDVQVTRFEINGRVFTASTFDQVN
ncbi:hypothetical protein [Granulicella mallensis]|uniref:Uncharacterized protein n=1 Tax=Granulicella mallensis (strain ATCC BAA-1857 / DSM 23137 / MP5ACTX8) TaxID=682795 RepID=G8NQE9_GRAMM|nr:hypothetical protein [Granulicella mallensis]AEU36098.1 hypothetical protein AciX8_1759 [Granulicella mallensis MP5ACTX8]